MGLDDRMGKRGIVAIVAAVVLLAGAAGGVWWRHGTQERRADRQSRAAIDAFAAAWQGRSFDRAHLTFAGTTAAAVAADFRKATTGLGDGPVTVRVGDFTRRGDGASADLAVTWTLPGAVPWSYTVPLRVARTASGAWAVQPPARGDAASFWHPALRNGDTLTATRTQGRRGDLLDHDGAALMPLGKVYPVQLDPSRATPDVASTLERIVGEPAGSLVAKLKAAKDAQSRAPIPVITYRQSDFDAHRAALDALTGVVYPAREQPLARTRSFGQPLLGSFGPVTAEVVTRSDGRYAAGDLAGLSGLQGQYDSVLAGTSGVTVTSSGNPGRPLFEKAPQDGADVQTTLEPAVQAAAEKALQRTGTVPSALVAVDVTSGDVVAAANSPAFGFDRAITGRYPPGSSFKVATSYALLTQGKVTPSSVVDCPKTVVVDGMTVKNYEGEELGSPTFAQDFAHSCNTAFVSLASSLDDNALAAAGKALGIGAGWAQTLGVAGAFAGQVPVNTGKTDKAAASIGQGRDLVSPTALAVMAASVARGSFIPPVLATAPGAHQDRTPEPLDPTAVSTLRDLMGQVVQQGTGTVLKGTPGGAVHGKTGTAEFGTKNPPQTHAWFVGYQGDLAFAVLVEEGRSGGTVAAPVAKAFLTDLAGG